MFFEEPNKMALSGTTYDEDAIWVMQGNRDLDRAHRSMWRKRLIVILTCRNKNVFQLLQFKDSEI